MTSRAERGDRSIGVRVPPFQVFLDETRDHVYRFLVSLVGRNEADDCFQDTFVAALRAYPRLRDGENLRSWVLTIAHRKAMDHFRSARRRPEPVAIVPEEPGARAPHDDAVPIWDAVDGLPPKQRAAVVLRFKLGLRYREIAEVLRSSEAAARQNVREAKRTLGEVLA